MLHLDGKSEWCRVLSLIDGHWPLVKTANVRHLSLSGRTFFFFFFTDYFFPKVWRVFQMPLRIRILFQLDINCDVCSFKGNTVNTSIVVSQCMLCFAAGLQVCYCFFPYLPFLFFFLNLGWDRCPVVVVVQKMIW